MLQGLQQALLGVTRCRQKESQSDHGFVLCSKAVAGSSSLEVPGPVHVLVKLV